MPNNQSTRHKITWATILFLVALLPPVLNLFNKPILAGGIPLLFAYIFCTWMVYILFTAWQARKTDN
jgi:hypothetical protein